MAQKARVGVNVLHRIDNKAAEEIVEGAFVKRDSDGKCEPADDSTKNVTLGVAEDNLLEQTVLNKYSQYDAVPIITSGVVRVWCYEAAITAGMYLLVADDFGFCKDDGGRDAAESVARALEDAASAAYTTAGLAVTAGTKSVTVTSTAYFTAGDMVLLDSGTDSTSEVAEIDAILTTTTLTLKEKVTNTQSSKDMHLLVQVEAELL